VGLHSVRAWAAILAAYLRQTTRSLRVLLALTRAESAVMVAVRVPIMMMGAVCVCFLWLVCVEAAYILVNLFFHVCGSSL
jgi:hypothetical protein